MHLNDITLKVSVELFYLLAVEEGNTGHMTLCSRRRSGWNCRRSERSTHAHGELIRPELLLLLLLLWTII